MSKRVLNKILSKFKDKVISHHNFRGDETVEIHPDILIDVCRFLKEDSSLDFNMLVDITAVDGLELGWNPRFKVVYHLYSLSKGHRIRLKVPVSDKDPKVSSVTSIWKGANWPEREVYDMFGIRFEGHPDLRRILLYDEFEGHPLRKDYPIDLEQPIYKKIIIKDEAENGKQ